jgi:hypothetical protein
MCIARASNVNFMAVAKSGKGGCQEGEGPGKMSSEKPSGLCRVMKTRLADEGENEIMDVGEHPGTLSDGETGRIFFKGHIPSAPAPNAGTV